MKKAIIIIASIFAVLIISFLIVYPHIEIDTGEMLVRCSYSNDISEYDVNHSYSELYAYNEKHDVSISNFNVEKFLFFYAIHMEYIPGDFRETQFLLEESYIENFIENAEIYDNEKNIDVKKLIEGKKAIVENKRYKVDYEEKSAVYYMLDGKDQVLYVFYVDDLLVIQVGYSDELPKFIAYK